MKSFLKKNLCEKNRMFFVKKKKMHEQYVYVLQLTWTARE